jgi:hypothetical protein
MIMLSITKIKLELMAYEAMFATERNMFMSFALNDVCF